ncbi:MAG TPA: exosortase K [Polyangiaceae bacterium]|nr:exosortase K [Polyangiaceae bacterium]
MKRIGAGVLRMCSSRRRDAAFGGAALAITFALKLYYSSASAEGLRWILTPTSWLTKLLTQMQFNWLTDRGYLSNDESVLIAPACAGVNFLIVAFFTLVVLGIGRFESLRTKALFFAGAGAWALFGTILVNALRIAASIHFSPWFTRHLGWSFHSVHRSLGVVLYLSALLLFTGLILGRATVKSPTVDAQSSRDPRCDGERARSSPPRVRFDWVPFAFALGTYWLFVLVLPGLRWLWAARRNPRALAFDAEAITSHGREVLFISLAVSAVAWMTVRLSHRFKSS